MLSQAWTRWGGHRRALSWLLVVAAGLPVVAGIVRAVGSDWVPLGDEGVIVARAFDVLTRHTPLLGQSSVSGSSAGQATHSLGPLEYWLLALPARTSWASASVVVVGLVNLVCVAGAVRIAAALGGLRLALTLTASLIVLAWSLDQDLLVNVWNPWAALAPLVLVIMAAWAVGAGRIWLMPVLALTGSYVMQLHLTYVLPTLACVVAAAGGLVVLRLAPSAGWRRPLALTALVLVVCWTAPAIEQLTSRPGNVVALARTATSGDPTLGVTRALGSVVGTVGLLPWWLDGDVQGGDLIAGLTDPPPLHQTLTAILFIAGLLCCLVVAWRRREGIVVLGCVLALGLLASLALVVRSTPADLGITLTYVGRWGTIAGVYAWSVLGWAVWELAVAGRVAQVRRRRLPTGRAGVVVMLVAGVVVALAGNGDRRSGWMPHLDPALGRLDAALGGAPRVRLESEGVGLTAAGVEIPLGLVSSLRRQGREVDVQPVFAALLGAQYADRPGRVPTVIVSAAGGQARGELIARVEVQDPAGPVSIALR